MKIPTSASIPRFYCRPPTPLTVAENEDEYVDPIEMEEVMSTFIRYMLSLGNKPPKNLQQIRDFLLETYNINLNGYHSFIDLKRLAKRVRRGEHKPGFTLERYARRRGYL